jgi:hypothetical protein
LASPTDSLEVFTGYLYDLVLTNQVALGVVGAPRRVRNTLESYIIVYFSKVTDVQENARDADVMGDALEALVHANITFGGLVTNSMVILNESGYRPKPDTQFRAVRLTVQGQSTTMLPMAPGYNQP